MSDIAVWTLTKNGHGARAVAREPAPAWLTGSGRRLCGSEKAGTKGDVRIG
jgi:hypothetical protein